MGDIINKDDKKPSDQAGEQEKVNSRDISRYMNMGCASILESDRACYVIMMEGLEKFIYPRGIRVAKNTYICI